MWISKLWIQFVRLKWGVLIGCVLVVCAFWGIRPFILDCQIYVCRVFLSMPYYPHKICGVCSGILFIPDFGNLGQLLFYFCLFFFEVCELTDFCRENQLFVSWVFSVLDFIDLCSLFMSFFCFGFHWFLLFISFFLLALCLFCSLFSSFLRVLIFLI